MSISHMRFTETLSVHGIHDNIIILKSRCCCGHLRVVVVKQFYVLVLEGTIISAGA